MSCPICGEETQKKFRPFCSKRCADIDLAKWLNGSYAVPSQREDDPESAADADEHNTMRPH
ncbi:MULTISPECIES: DNA gyrase inhibitor YacG [unclassified Ruegeria]|uniref:DNA gyrase inhibitor YacG n=1 Tax=unclassified Ruegeria TaxID=2625375 RepID=UPI001AE29881|nr:MULTISPECIES: DNA gyrase inhibitor YacG [unclassified Ruegeria]